MEMKRVGAKGLMYCGFCLKFQCLTRFVGGENPTLIISLFSVFWGLHLDPPTSSSPYPVKYNHPHLDLNGTPNT